MRNYLSSRPLLAAALLVVVPLEACKGCAEQAVIPGWLSGVDAAPVGVYAADGVGIGAVEVPVFAMNALGAAVPGVAITATSAIALDAATVTTDAGGWGVVSATPDLPGGYPIEVSGAGEAATGTAWAVAAAPGAFEYVAHPAGGDASAAAVAGGGVAWAVGDEVWWSAPGTGAPVRVAKLGSAILSMVPCEGDADGQADLAVWSASAVVILRGRDGGGLTWGAGFTAAEGQITGVAMADASGDAITDLGVALNFDGASGVLLLHGDGGWAFSPADFLEIPFPVLGMSVEDLDADGGIEVTVLTEDGILRRFAKFEGEWASTSTSSEYALHIGAGSRLLPSSDIDGDGIVDLIAAGPALDQSGAQAWVVTAGAAAPTLYHMFVDDDETDGDLPASVSVSLGDLTGDGVVDLGIGVPGGFTRASWGGDGFRTQTYTELPTGAVAVGNLVEDEVIDVAVVNSRVVLLPGERVADNPNSSVDDSVAWRPRTPDVKLVGLAATQEPWIGDVNADEIADVVTFIDTQTGLGLQAYTGVAATDTAVENLHSGGVKTFPVDTLAVDLAVCGASAFALVSDAMGATSLYRYDIGVTGGLSQVGDALVIGGAAVACGDYAAGIVAVVGDDGAVSYVSDAGATTPGLAVEGAEDVATADQDGDGVDELIGCAEPGCELAVGDFDGDGRDDIADASPAAGLSVVLGDAVFDLGTTGSPRASDADADGIVDLVVGEDGAVEVYRGFAAGFAPASVRYVYKSVTGAARFGDLDGDGTPDVFLFGRDPDPTDDVDVSTGTMIYVHASP